MRKKSHLFTLALKLYESLNLEYKNLTLFSNRYKQRLPLGERVLIKPNACLSVILLAKHKRLAQASLITLEEGLPLFSFQELRRLRIVFR